MIGVLLACVNLIILGCNILVLWIVIKLYTEILKIEHVKRIGEATHHTRAQER